MEKLLNSLGSLVRQRGANQCNGNIMAGTYNLVNIVDAEVL